MVATEADNGSLISAVERFDFAGDGVQLAGQIDYPDTNRPMAGYPLIFIIQHSTSMSRKDFQHIADLAKRIGMATFRWDKRGTGKSGNGIDGSVEEDTRKAYEFALSLPSIDPTRVVILAQSEGTRILSSMYTQLIQIAKPLGVILSGNMLDEKTIVEIDVPLHIVVSKNDWNAWQIYAEKAADAHANHYDYEASFYVATNTNRLLMYTSGNMFHKGAASSIKHWLKTTCQIS